MWSSTGVAITEPLLFITIYLTELPNTLGISCKTRVIVLQMTYAHQILPYIPAFYREINNEQSNLEC